tara:strand:- start:25623 stop:25937 length:315 start_codon:yes stop_codon:yes gene_type:complete
MGFKTVTPPRLPSAPDQYSAQYQEQFMNILRLYFNQINAPLPAIFASAGVGTTEVVGGLTFAQPSPTTPGQFTISLPTQADVANLRSGDVYYDTTAGNVLKIKV